MVNEVLILAQEINMICVYIELMRMTMKKKTDNMISNFGLWIPTCMLSTYKLVSSLIQVIDSENENNIIIDL